MEKSQSIRIDKYLWAVRLFKTRSLAAEACKKSKVLINKQAVKSSRLIKKGEIIQIKKNPALFTYLIKELLEKRVGAKLVNEYLEDITPEDELEKLKLKQHFIYFKRDRGSGRPTKKDRRDIDNLNI